MIILSILVTLLLPLLVLVVVPYLFISFDLAIFPQALGVWEIIAILLILGGGGIMLLQTLTRGA